MFDFSELEKKMRLLTTYKEKKPKDFFEAYKIACECNVTSKKTIDEAIELYTVEKGFGVK